MPSEQIGVKGGGASEEEARESYLRSVTMPIERGSFQKMPDGTLRFNFDGEEVRTKEQFAIVEDREGRAVAGRREGADYKEYELDRKTGTIVGPWEEANS